jgi:hypothetical protein
MVSPPIRGWPEPVIVSDAWTYATQYRLLAGGIPAVDGEHLSGDVASTVGAKEGKEERDLFRAPRSSERNCVDQLRADLRIDVRRERCPRNPAETQFTVTPCGPTSRAVASAPGAAGV